MEMKAYLIAAALAVSNAYSATIHWAEDSTTSFSLTIAGTGLSWTDTFTSPSGLWQLTARGEGAYRPEIASAPMNINHGGRMVFLGLPAHFGIPGLPDHPFLFTSGYNDFFPVAKTLSDNANFNVNSNPFESSGWVGRDNPFIINSLPDPTDPSTWTWAMHFAAHGPSPISRVPESGGIVCLAFAAGLLLFFRPRKEKAWTS